VNYLHEVMAETLAANGVDSVFGLAGDGNLFLVDTYSRIPGVRYYAAVHEAGVVMAACGYAQRTGRLGVATVTRGPGAGVDQYLDRAGRGCPGARSDDHDHR
jgi:acetolactate synthase-1/2/3 large subunit